jgi:hypothetical protein
MHRYGPYRRGSAHAETRWQGPSGGFSSSQPALMSDPTRVLRWLGQLKIEVPSGLFVEPWVTARSRPHRARHEGATAASADARPARRPLLSARAAVSVSTNRRGPGRGSILTGPPNIGSRPTQCTGRPPPGLSRPASCSMFRARLDAAIADLADAVGLAASQTPLC